MSTSATRSRSHPVRRFLARLAVAGFALRALVPAGYMPASLETGSLFELCHGGMAGAYFEALDAHLDSPATAGHAHAHDAAMHHGQTPASDDAPAAAHDAWENCSFGAAFASAALVSASDLPLLSLADAPVQYLPAYAARPAFLSPYQARAPPALLNRQLI